MERHSNERHSDDRRIVVIGAGLAGLTAAATAAAEGADVTLVEAREHEGGRARSTTVGDFVFNQGPHALYRAGAALPILRALGVEPRGGTPSVNGVGRLRGRVDRLPGTPVDAMRTRLIGTRDKMTIGRRFAKPAKLLDTPIANRSMQTWIDEQFRSEDARLLVAFLARTATYCDDLDRLDAAAGAAQMVRAFTDGVIYLDDGWQQLVNGLRRACDARGVKVVNAKVTAVPRSANGFVIVGDHLHVDAERVIVAAGGPQHAAALLDRVSAESQTWVDRCEPVVATCLDLGLDRLPVPDRRFAAGIDQPIYLSVHTPSARLVTGVGEVVHVMRYGRDDGDARTVLEGFLDDIHPGWRDRVIHERFGRQLTVAYNRPRADVAPIDVSVADSPGIFVAGDWLGGAEMLADASVSSGAEAARLALA
jgi:phytoene dehydrogenase-like protein